MNLFNKSVLAGALLTASASAFAATVDMTISGTIKPPSCTPTLNNAGILDLGQIHGLSKTATTALPAQQITLSIVCSAPSSVGFQLVDNRSASRMGGSHAYGLGLSNANPIGNYTLSVQSVNTMVDGAVGQMMYKNGVTGTWLAHAPTADHGLNANTPTLFHALSTIGSTSPVPVTTMMIPIDVKPTINRSSLLDMTQAIPLDGSATIEVVYL